MTPSARRALLRDASDAWQEVNVALQIIGDAVSHVYGKGKRLRRSVPIDVRELLEDIELE